MSNLSELAVNGGTPAIQPRRRPRFHFGQEEKAAVDALFDAAAAKGSPPGYNGAEEEAFCKEFCAFMGGGYADGVNSGTNSLFVALRALELPPFSEVVVGCVTDPGGAMPVVLNNCIPVPADTAPGSFMPGPEQIEERITERTSAILIAHIGGDPADMPGILKVAEKHGLPVVEDCAQAHAAKINGRNVGWFGAAGGFSLMFGKHICTGGQGGAVFTKNEELYWKMRRMADRGKPFNLPGHTNCDISINCNLDEIHAAIGRAQLKKLPDIVARRRQAVQYLWDNGIDALPGLSSPQRNLPTGFESCYWRLRLHLDLAAYKCSKMDYAMALTAEGLEVTPDYHAGMPFLMEWYAKRANSFPWNNPLYKGDPSQEYPCPNAEAAVNSDILLQVYESYTPDYLDMVLNAFRKVNAAFSR